MRWVDVGERTVVGEIALLQIQRSQLGDGRVYRPGPILEVERLRLTPAGVYGLVAGAWILDRHHRDHPDAQSRWSEHRVLSVGFTSHYEQMWKIFRSTVLGSAGENVLVTAEEMVTIGDIAGGVRFETDHTIVELGPAAIAEPCVPFTRFMTNLAGADTTALKPEREKLRHGVRGFVMGLAGVDHVEISPGDKVSIRGS